MRARAFVWVVLVFGAWPAAAGAESHSVSIPGKFFAPAQLTVVVGDEVTWRNTDVQEHDVRAVDGGFDSGVMGRFGSFTVRFDAMGARPYLCMVHPFMRGQVDAVAAVLHGPAGSVLAGEPVRLEGRAAPGTAVTLERRMPDGSWQAVAGVASGSDGSFAFSAVAAEGAAYRAATAVGPSPVVALAVTARLAARIAVHPGERRTRVTVRTAPAQPGLFATLQRYSRERFMWRRVDHARLDSHGRASFHVRSSRGGRVRITLSRTLRGPALATTAGVAIHGSPGPTNGHTPHPSMRR